LLEVGPHSAGADPGPICYGRGGTDVTISDANLMLGRLDPSRLASVTGGAEAQVRTAFEAQLCKPLGLDVTTAAAAVIRMANTKMAGAIRMVSVSLGADPRDFTLFAFGGAGPLHACALARELGVPRVLVPARPGITNALGCVVADLRHDYVRTLNTPLDTLDMEALARVFAEQSAEGSALIDAEKIEITNRRHLYSVDMQFVGQTHLIRVPLPGPDMSRADLQQLFEEAYFNRFRVELNNIRANLVNANTSVIGARAPLDLSTLIDPGMRKSTLEAAETDRCRVMFEDWYDTPVYWRDHLPAGFALTGPAVIQQMDCTTLIEPGDTARGDENGNILIEVSQ